ncbi:hypothetical protein BGZ59_007970 [Podila verticillata]|nr:hypothetical protein BGZ59_007970 [Podila verticillata]
MSDTFPLPIECLQLVITNLAVQHELKALVALLRVNKHVCLATLPILYEDPFVWFLFHDQDRPGCSFYSSHRRVFPVIRLLLASVPNGSYSGLIKAIYRIGDALELPDVPTKDRSRDFNNNPSTTPQHWPIDYLSYVRHFNTHDRFGESVLVHFASYLDLVSPLMSYVKGHTLADMCPASGLNLGKMMIGAMLVKEDPTEIEYLTLNIHRQATWALCSPILEQLQSIVIPLSDIGRYMDALPRLSSLATVTFKLDELADVSQYILSEEEVKKAHLLQKKREQDLESAVEFVRAHTALFPGTLKQVLSPYCTVQDSKQSYPKATLDQILELLPSLIDPLELVDKNWKQFIAKVERTNLDYVTTIDVSEQFASKSYDQLKSKPFLHRCPSLRKYDMISLGPDSFKWAIEWDGSNNDLDLDLDLDLDQHDRHARPATNLPPLEDVSISATEGFFGSELDDIGLGFGETIKLFTIRSQSQQFQETVIRSLTVGHAWKMPLLSKLDVKLNRETLVLDPDFLCYCPVLQSLSLFDRRDTHDLSGIKVGNPAFLPELTNLELVGSGALSFHPDTLHSTKELKTLKLESLDNSWVTIIPSLLNTDRDDHQQDNVITEAGSSASPIPRAKWTWNWHLPMLSTLHLTVEFAFRFQFRMLRETPNLQDLYLCISLDRNAEERVLTQDDFTIKPRPKDSYQEDDSDDRSSDGSTSTMDTIDRIDLHRLPFDDVFNICVYLFSLAEHSELQTDPEQDLICRELFYGVCPEKSTQERVIQAARAIEYIVDQFDLQPELESTFAEMRVLEARERQHEEDLKKYRAKHPDHLVVPSVKKLEIIGRWIISDEVLETMLGRVFCNVKELKEHLTEGYMLDTLVRVTQSMPRLQTVEISKPLDADALSDEHKMYTYSWDIIRPPFVSDARARVLYEFESHDSYTLNPTDGSGETEEVLVE